MNIWKSCLTIFLCSFIVFSSQSEEAKEEGESGYSAITQKRYNNYLGFAGGFITGNGLAYRRWFHDKLGIQVNVLPLYWEEKYPEDDGGGDGYYYTQRDSGYLNSGYINYGITLLVNFAEMKYLRFVGYAGGNHIIDIEEGNYYYSKEVWDRGVEANVVETEHNVVDNTSNTLAGGVGAGVEFYVFRFGFSVNFGIFGSYRFEDHAKAFQPSVDGGVFFRF